MLPPLKTNNNSHTKPSELSLDFELSSDGGKASHSRPFHVDFLMWKQSGRTILCSRFPLLGLQKTASSSVQDERINKADTKYNTAFRVRLQIFVKRHY